MGRGRSPPSPGQKCSPSPSAAGPSAPGTGRGYFGVRAAPRSRRGLARAGSAASLPVARTTGCDGAISIRAIAGAGRRWGVGGCNQPAGLGCWGRPPPPGWGSHEPLREPPGAACTVPSTAWWVPRGWGHGPMARGAAGARGTEQGAHGDQPQVPEEQEWHSPGAGAQLPHPDAPAPPQTQGGSQGQAGGPRGPLHPAAPHRPGQRGSECPEAPEQQ